MEIFVLKRVIRKFPSPSNFAPSLPQCLPCVTVLYMYIALHRVSQSPYFILLSVTTKKFFMTRLYYINKFTKIPLLLAWPYHVNMLVLEFRRFNSVLYPCWNATPKKRPTFTKICTFIEQFRNGMHSTSGYYAAPGASTGMEAPPGYYAARDAIQDNTGRDNGALYHDARSG